MKHDWKVGDYLLFDGDILLKILEISSTEVKLLLESLDYRCTWRLEKIFDDDVVYLTPEEVFKLKLEQ